MKKLAFVLLVAALPLGGCDYFKAGVTLNDQLDQLTTATVPVTKAQAQQVLADIQKGHAIIVRSQNAYLDLKPCGNPGSPAPPLCASLKVSRQWTAYDRAFTATMDAAQNEVATLGDDPKALGVAVQSVRVAFAALNNFKTAHATGVKP